MFGTVCGLMGILLGFSDPVAGLSRQEPLELRGATANGASVSCYGKFELTLDLGATYSNPFDPDDIDVYALMTSPDGRKMRVNGFFTQPFSRELKDNQEVFSSGGDPVWQIRFSPDKAGAWRYQVFAKDRSGTVSLPEAGFDATASDSAGFIRRNAKSPHVFAFDNGQSYFAVGANMCWAHGRGTFDYDDWLAGLGSGGGNWMRIWVCQWNCGLEWSADEKGKWHPEGYNGVGVYNLRNAQKLDIILDTAEQNGVYTMLCLGTYGELMTGGYFNEGMWAGNAYNVASGGPCEKPEDFWSNEQARKLYQRRLRYLAARYGWRSSVFGWEFWNEAKAPAAWVQEMAQFLKGKGPFEGNPADPYGHLVSTTYGDADVWKLAEIDFTQSHHYGEGNVPDSGPVIHNDANQHRQFGKPHFMAEFGIDWRSSDNKYDDTFRGINLHNGLWASALSGNAGGAMIWYWDGYVHPGKLYGQFSALRRFTDTVPWNEGPWTPVEADPPQIPAESETWSDLTIKPTLGWERNPVAEYEITPDKGSDGKALPTLLFSPGKPEVRSPLVMRVNYEKPGTFSVKVDTVSLIARVRFLLDGAEAKVVTLAAAPPEDKNVAPEYESTEFKPQWNIYQAKFNKAYGIDVPAGAHTIAVEVTDGDWMSVSAYVFGGYTSSRFTCLNFYGVTNGTKAYAWAQNSAHNWINVKDNVAIAPIKSVKVGVHGLPNGKYGCEWWDTWAGKVSGEDTAECVDGALVLALPELATDVAVAVHLVP